MKPDLRAPDLDRPPKKQIDVDPVGGGAALLSVVEVGLGSLLHAGRVPLAGQLLSLNQGFLLTRFSSQKPQDKFVPAKISNISALLKSLAPAGKRLTPMLAISAQGLLFNLGILVAGNTLIGQGLGMALLCLWAYVQPVLIYLILYGQTLIDVGVYFVDKLSSVVSISQETLIFILLSLILLKIFIGLGLVFLARRLNESRFTEYSSFLTGIGKKKIRLNEPKIETEPPKRKIVWLATRDLFRPIFLVSLAVTLLFFIFSQADVATVIWGLLRPIAIGFLLFYIIRSFPFENFLKPDSPSPFLRSARYALNRLKLSQKTDL